MDVLLNLRKGVIKELEEQAKEHNRSLEEEVKAILDAEAERAASKNRLRPMRPYRGRKLKS
jgi:plasmid stability protein